MDRGTRRLFIVALVILVAAVGLATILLTAPTSPTGGPPDTTAVEGVIVGTEQDGVLSISAFELRTAGGSIRSFRLDQLENGTEFPPGHLLEHAATAEPVRVWYREGPGVDWAIRLEDATPGGAAS